MRQTQLFTKALKDFPKDEKSVNAQLLIRAGFVDKLMAGVYSYLPLGLRVLKKIENIIREEMNAISGQEVLLPTLHPKEAWQVTDRWKYEEMFKLKSRSQKDLSLGWTHEEIITPTVKKFVRSYKDLPLFVYQIQNKFRDELRAKSGLLRGVEFLMKDLYSFHHSEPDLDNYYEKVQKAYFNIFTRCGLGERTYLTLASGGSFSKYPHEFQTITENGEDTIYLCSKCKIAINKEIIEDEKNQCPQCKNKKLEELKAIEVGNIFKLKDRFSKAFDLTFTDKAGKKKPVVMGCYGIGLGRLLGTAVEVGHDKDGIIWSKEIAPFQVHLISLGENKNIIGEAEAVYRQLTNGQAKKIEVLYDDRAEKSAGEKFAEADLIGIPFRLVISERTLKDDSIEVKERGRKESKLIKINQLPKFIESL